MIEPNLFEHKIKRKKNTTQPINKKVVYGQFFTKENIWLKKHILAFIQSTHARIAYDPFAGAGDLLQVAKNIGFKRTKGLDIDGSLGWKANDSLRAIPPLANAIIITNPPYLSSYSASRKKVHLNLVHYFKHSPYDNLYLIALDKMLDAVDYVVAIIPETFINSNYLRKNRLHSLTILEDNPFYDTDTPVLVACFDNVAKNLNRVLVYKNDEYVNTLGNLEAMRPLPTRHVAMRFNDRSGWLGVRCVDTTDPGESLRFDFKENIPYKWERGIKTSSRLLTLVQIDVPPNNRAEFIRVCNELLNTLRAQTADVILSPFKGNRKDGTRRRRLDFLTCRAIIERAYDRMFHSNLGELFHEN